MKPLVAYYSRTGNTRKVAEKIAQKLNADIDEIVDHKKREKAIGWIFAGRDATLKKHTDISFQKDPTAYDFVIIGTPVWAFSLTPAVRTYLSKNKIKNVAFFCTHGGRKGKVFEEMEKLSLKPKAVLDIVDKNIDECEEKINNFCSMLSS